MERKEKLLLVGGDIATPDAIQYCKSIGVYTIMTNDIPYENNPYKQMADESWEIPVDELDLLEEKCREAGVTAVFAGVNEHNLDITKKLAERLGLPFYASDEGWACARDKGRFKKHCTAVGLDVPKRYDITKPFHADMLAAINYPVIVKPVDSCGSQGISVCHCENELEEFFDKALSFSASGDILVEDYIDGNEFMIFFCFINGKPLIYHFSSQQRALVHNRKVVVFGTQMNKDWNKWEEKYNANMEALFEKLDCKQGCGFLQGSCRDGKYYLFEFGYRLDGMRGWRDMTTATGFNALEMQVDLALGNTKREYPFVPDCKKPYLLGSIYFVYAKAGKLTRIVGMDALKQMENVFIHLNRFHENDEILANNSMYQIALTLHLEAPNEQETIAVLKEINSTVHFYDENGNDMLNYFEDYDVYK